MGTGRLKERVPGKNKDWGRNSKGQSRGCRGSLEQLEGARAEEPEEAGCAMRRMRQMQFLFSTCCSQS